MKENIYINVQGKKRKYATNNGMQDMNNTYPMMKMMRITKASSSMATLGVTEYNRQTMPGGILTTVPTRRTTRTEGELTLTATIKTASPLTTTTATETSSSSSTAGTKNVLCKKSILSLVSPITTTTTIPQLTASGVLWTTPSPSSSTTKLLSTATTTTLLQNYNRQHQLCWLHTIAASLLLMIIVVLPPAVLVQATTLDIYKNARLGHRIVQTRYGRLHGLILPLDNFRFLRSVEVFLGVPYATPPIKQNRFSPTRAPAPWDGIRISDKYSPVCPQRLPNIQNETAALEKMPKGRLEYLKRLLPFLENQSEDCLYLNIFTPMNAGASEKKLPVIVFIHGESFEWSSGNPYDGSVLASYGEVVVVTLNYRLGILGFLNANPSPLVHARVANYGLMDQIAALHWIQQNIQKFGGDPNLVTLGGHGTGAACINFLMASPTMVRGLFQRTILMSGSAFSSWALVEDPVMFAVRLAREVNCSIPEDLNKHHEHIVDCLREIPLNDLYGADIQAPTFLTSFGPSVDGVVIRSGHSNLDADDLVTRNTKRSSGDAFTSSVGGGLSNFGSNLNYLNGAGGGGGGAFYSNGNSFSNGPHFDVLFGVVTGESIWRFSAHDIQNGFEGERRDKIIRTYVRNAYNYHLNEIFYTIVNEYTDWDRASQHPINTRDTAVAALSDAQFVAPIIRTADIFAINSPPPISSNPGGTTAAANSGATLSASTQYGAQSGRCYFYVFDYQTKDGDYPQRMGTVHGEDLPYIFGAPLIDGFSHFPQNYTKSEMALSEAVITYWANFARTGNPNEHHRQDSILAASKERNRFRSIVWENYDPLHQKYLEIGMKPRIKNHFRAHQLSVWLRLIPELHRTGMEDVIARHNLFRNHDDMNMYEGPVKPDPFRSERLLLMDEALMKKSRSNTSAFMASILGVTTMDPNLYTTCIPLGNANYTTGGVYSPTTMVNATTDTLSSGFEAAGYAAYSTALSVTIAIGCSLLILNVLIFAGVYYQRDKTRLEVKTLQKQYQQRNMHQQMPAYPPDPIKHAHYHMGHSQSANVIVDVENHGDQGTILLTASGSDIKPPPPHLCTNTSMQLTQQQQQQQHQMITNNVVTESLSPAIHPTMTSPNICGPKYTTNSPANVMDIVSSATFLGSNSLNNVTYSSTSKQQQQQFHQQQQQLQQQQQHEHLQIKNMNSSSMMGNSGNSSTNNNSNNQTCVRNLTTSNNNNNNNNNNNTSTSISYNTTSYSAGGDCGGGGGNGSTATMITMPKSGNTVHHTNSINYGRSPTMNLVNSNISTALHDGRTNMLLNNGSSSAGAGNNINNVTGDCITLPRNLSMLSRHNSESPQSNQQQQQQQQQNQLNGGIMTGMGTMTHHIRAPRPPIRTASSSTSTGCTGTSINTNNISNSNLIDQTPSNGSSSSGVSSTPSSSKGHSHQHMGHMHTHTATQLDGIGLTTTTALLSGTSDIHHIQQQVPQAAIDEMRV